jgi:hypothetical protein
MGFQKEFSRKKLICAKNMTKLPALTVPPFISFYQTSIKHTLNYCGSALALIINKHPNSQCYWVHISIFLQYSPLMHSAPVLSDARTPTPPPPPQIWMQIGAN